jgi:SsrA-binding protein
MTKPKENFKVIAQNKRAFYDYEVVQKIEAGMVLLGSEVKSLRLAKASIAQAYAANEGDEIFLYGSNISEYKQAKNFGHAPQRVRKLLLHRREIKKVISMITKKGYTLVPLTLYFNHKNIAKISLGVAKGKKRFDKREAEKQKDWQREKQRLAQHK